MVVNIIVLVLLLLKLVNLYMIMEVSSNGNSAYNATPPPHTLPSSEHSRKRKQVCKVAATPPAFAPANGAKCLQKVLKRTRVDNLANQDSLEPTCLHGRFGTGVSVREKQYSCAKVCPLSWSNAISEQWTCLKNEEGFADIKAKLVQGLALLESDSIMPQIYRDSVPNEQAQCLERQEQLLRQSKGDANLQFAWPSLKNEEEFADVKAKLIKGLGIFSSDALITGIYRDSSSKGQARQQAFDRQEELTREARGDANVQYAWHGTSKTGVSGIMLHGFGQPRTPKNGSAYGVGVYLAPENHADVSAVYADNDENGEQHMLLCRVILGKPEPVLQGSDQFHPSSEHFDTGADDLSAPKRLIVWSTHMNTHILPLYAVSFKLSPKWHEEWYDHVGGIQQQVLGPTSPCVSFPCLFVILRQQLEPEDLYFLEQHYVAFKAGRLPREQLIKVCRDVAGDALLVNAIRQLNNCQKAKQQELLKIKSLTSLSSPISPSFS
ncbi:unnamed protein product [Sphagnum jensenii]|uniref:Poly [ADP-ribose] polymerase n=1 Tax=Sphagnum jensenii TaxID=128206 RepID=A0ABP0WLN8_9BRYO